MINVYHLVDALPAALFGMLALWAASSRRHWFLRTAVVGAALLMMLLIPAYEPVIEFGVEALLVAGGLTWWRHRRRRQSIGQANELDVTGFRPRASLKNILLLMTVLAVVMAVFGHHTDLSIDQWVEFSGNGIAAASVALFAVWIVCGRARWWLRLSGLMFMVPLLGAEICLLQIGRITLFRWIRDGTSPASVWQQTVMQQWLESTAEHWTVVVAIGSSLLCLWVWLMRQAAWFDPFRESYAVSAEGNTGATRRARWMTLAIGALVAIFPLLLFYKLLTPTPIPIVDPPVPNGFDDLVAAGQIMSNHGEGRLWESQLSDDQLRGEWANRQAAFDRMREGLARECKFPFSRSLMSVEQIVALEDLMDGLFAWGDLADRTGDPQTQRSAYFDLLCLTNAENRSRGIGKCEEYAEHGAIDRLWNCRSGLASKQSVELAKELWAMEDQREPWEDRANRARIIDENSGWESHLRAILSAWCGDEPHLYERHNYWLRMVEMRVLIVDLAIRAKLSDTGKLPESLTELVSDYLSVVPDDPYGQGLLKYHLTADGYVLYSVGPDGNDDGGKPVSNRPDWVGDLTPADLFPPTILTCPIQGSP